MSKGLHPFGELRNWSLDLDDGCILICVLVNTDWVATPYIFREAYDEIDALGGFEECVKYLRHKLLGSETVN